MMENAKKNYLGWIGLAVLGVAYLFGISGWAWVNNTNTNRNAVEIEKQQQIHREDMRRMEGLILEGFREIRREINEIKK